MGLLPATPSKPFTIATSPAAVTTATGYNMSMISPAAFVDGTQHMYTLCVIILCCIAESSTPERVKQLADSVHQSILHHHHISRRKQQNMLTTTAVTKAKYKPRSRLPVAADRNSSTVLHRKETAQADNTHSDVNTELPVNNVMVTQLLKSPQPVSPQECIARPLLFTTPTDQQQAASPDVTPMNINNNLTLKDPQDVLADKIASYVASSGSLSPDSKVS